MYTALYRAYRPEVFDEIMGQEHIVRILKNQLKTDTVSHAYLFCGTRGTGKTTMARILAKGLNCTSEGSKPCGVCSACRSIKEGTYLDVVEIDAASNNSVDNIRELKESVKYPPAAGKKKIYIVDEVHMLSTGAFNALLKTLEEPPEYVVFILATTEPQKLPATILSRCMRLDFKRIPEAVLVKGMADICSRRGVDVSEDALHIIAANADGSVRDGLSILDQCISGGETHVNREDVLDFLGASGEEVFTELTESVRKGRTAEALMLIESELADGKDVRQFLRDWINHYRNLLMVKFMKDPQSVINLSLENIDRIRRQSSALDLEEINNGILELSRILQEAKWSTQPRILLELAVINLSSGLQGTGSTQSKENMTVRRSRQGMASMQERKNSAQIPPLETCSDKPEMSVSSENGLTSADSPSAGKSNETDEAVVNKEKYDLDAIWQAVFKEGEKIQKSFYIVGAQTELVAVQEHSFIVSINSMELVKDYAENNRELIEDLMEKHTGVRRSMKLVMRKEITESEQEKTAEEIADEGTKKFRMKFEVE